MTSHPDAMRCSEQTYALGERPGGSATAADHFILAELSTPWPAKIEQHSTLSNLPAPPSDGPSTRILGIRGPEETSGEHTKVISYRRDPSVPFTSYQRRETDVDDRDLADVLGDLLTNPDSLAMPTGPDLVDVLLCAHGTRDRCCGQFGTLLYVEMLADPPPNTRFWRTSHTGGHRFAPTGITFPDGMTWAHLDAETLRGVLDRSHSSTALQPHNRGCAALGSRPCQVADLALFEQFGWSWLDVARTAKAEQRGDDEWDVLVLAGEDRYLVTLRAEEPLPVPVCSEPIDQATKHTPQLAVERINAL